MSIRVIFRSIAEKNCIEKDFDIKNKLLDTRLLSVGALEVTFKVKSSASEDPLARICNPCELINLFSMVNVMPGSDPVTQHIFECDPETRAS